MQAAKINWNWRVINGIKYDKAIAIAQSDHIPMRAFTKEQLLKIHQNVEITEFIKDKLQQTDILRVSQEAC